MENFRTSEQTGKTVTHRTLHLNFCKMSLPSKNWTMLLGLVCFVLMAAIADASLDSEMTNEVEMQVNRDVLKHSIEYLRTQLISCMSQGKTHRTKRKAHMRGNHELEYQVEIDVLKNTQQYLMSRLVSCRQGLYSLTGRHSTQEIPVYESALLLDAQPTNQETESQHGSYSEPESANQVSAAQSNRKYGHRHESHVSGHYGDKSSELKHAHKQQENEFKMVEILSDPIGPDTTTTSTTTTVTTQRPTTTTTTTTAAPVPAQTFIVNGRAVQCKTYVESSDATSFTCRNVMVDDVWRLPNFDLCPPLYSPIKWRHLAQIHSRTFSVLDLKSLCRELGRSAGLGTKIRDVKVIWDCSDTHYRLTFLSGKWTGSVEDNGYLRDLQCVFAP